HVVTPSLCYFPAQWLLSAIFCNLPLSTSFNPGSEKSCISLDWVLASGIPGNTICSMDMSLSVSSPLAYDLVLGWDWLFFCRETYPVPLFSLPLYYLSLHFISFLIPR
ncbi:hypothetical protein B0H14DRAFT_2913509, partial [Mycena olivaceomarginata]